MASTTLTIDLQGLNLEDLGLPSEMAQELGAIPKANPIQSVAEHEAVAPTEDPSVSISGSKKRKSRRQRRKKPAEIPPPSVETPAQVFEDLLAGRIPDLILAEPELEEPQEPIREPAQVTHASTSHTEKRGGARRKKGGGGKRRKQKSPSLEAAFLKCSDNKENEKLEMPDIKLDSDESDDDERPSGKKFHWRNVTKNGWIKKCILVDGLIENGRPKPGDTVLVKSQGKLKDGTIIDDLPTLVFNVGEHEVIEGLDLVVQSMFKNELSIVSLKPEMAYGTLGRKADIPANCRITYLMGLLHFEKQKEIAQLTWAQRRKSGQTRMRLANWWYQRKEYPVAVKCYKKALEYYNNIPTNQECNTPEEYKELLQLMEERLRVMRQVANIFKRIANMIQSGQITA